jgi:hypothetical protein
MHEECPAGSGCNYSKCTAIASLSTGTATESSRFCESLIRNGNTCDDVVVKIGGSVVDYPYSCDLGQTCSYSYSSTGTSIVSAACPCNGSASATSSNCMWMDGMQYDAYDASWFQFSSSDCSGSATNAVSVDFDECNNVNQSDIEDFVAYNSIHEYWPLYQSGVLDSCAVDLDLFDPSTDDTSNAAALAVGILMALVF